MSGYDFADMLLDKDAECDCQWVLIKNAQVIVHGNDTAIFAKIRDRCPWESMLLRRIPNAEDLKLTISGKV